MTVWQTISSIIQVVLTLLLTSTVISKIIEVRSAEKASKQKRKENLEDRAMEKDDKTETLQEQFDAFVANQNAENYEMRQRLRGVETTLGKFCDHMAAGEYNNLRKEALCAIRKGRIDPEERVVMLEAYDRYVDITGKTDLDSIMEQVRSLLPE